MNFIINKKNSLYSLLSKTYHGAVDNLEASLKILEDFEAYYSSLDEPDKDVVDQHLYGLRQAVLHIRNSPNHE